MVKTNIQTFSGEVEVLEEFYVGSNLVANDVATHVLTINNTNNDAKIKSDFFVGDGGLLSNIATTLQSIADQGNAASNVILFNSNTDVAGYKNVGFVTTSNVGIQNTAPTHTMSIGDKIIIDNNTDESQGESVMLVHGRISADRFQGDGGLLSNIATTLESIADQGNASSNVLIFNSNTDISGYRGVGFVTTSNVGIQNTNPGFNTLSVGSNLFVNIYGSNVLTVHGNAAVSNLLVSEFSVSPAHGLQHVTQEGRATNQTVQLTNTTTGLEVSSNINVAGEVILTNATKGLDVTSNIEIGGRLKFDTNVFVDTLRVADVAANIVTYDRTTGELLDSSGTFMNKFAVVSEQPPSDLFANATTVTNHGGYTLTTSNLATNSNTYNAFDGTANAWVSGDLAGGYIGGANVFHENNLTQLSNLHPTQFGDWLAIEFPYKTTLRHMKLTPLTAAQFPASANLYATNNDLTWTEVNYWSGRDPVTASNVQTITVNATEQFKKYALVATKAAGNSSNVALQDWQLFTESFSIDGGKVAMAQQAATGGETVMDQHGPHGRGVVPLKKYPEIVFEEGKFDRNDTASPEYFIQSGYKVTASGSFQDIYYPWRAFDGLHNHSTGQTGWYSRNVGGNYNKSYNGSPVINLGTASGGTATVNGEYLTLEIPNKICLKRYTLYGPNQEREFPADWTLYGSNDGTLWESIDSQNGQVIGSGTSNTSGSASGKSKSYSIVNTTQYDRYAIVVTKINSLGYYYFGLQGLELYGYEEDQPLGDTSVDTTFTSIMNTPQTTGAQVYVDGSLGGNANTNRVVGPAAANTAATYDTTGKYWELNGTLTSNIAVEANTVLSGDAPHSLSMWFNSSNLVSNASNSCIFSLGTEERLDHVSAAFSNNYQTVQKITASDGATNEYFGAGHGEKNIAMTGDGSVVVSGAKYDNGNIGAVYVFVKDANGHWNEVQKLTASDATADDLFGAGVDISSDGNYIAIGARLAHSTDGNNVSNVGKLYIFKRTTGTNSWSEQQILSSPNEGEDDHFGRRVSISSDGTYVVTACQNEDHVSTDNRGAAYVFKRTGTTWATAAYRLVASDAADSDFFGSVADISDDGNFIAIGGSRDDGVGTDDNGSVYMFARTGDNTWTQQQKINNPDVSGVDNYFGGENQGASISSDGTYLIVGAYGRASNTGAVFFFKRTGTSTSDWAWGQIGGTYTEPDGGATGNLFGRAVRMSPDGTVALVHSRNDEGGTDVGAVFVYKRSGSTWTYKHKIQHKDQTAGDFFGSALDISTDGSYFVAGMYEDDDLGSKAGAAYIYTRDTTHHLMTDLKLQSNTWHNLTYAYQGEGGSRVTYLDGRKVAEDQAEDTFGDYPPFAMTGYSQGGYVVSSSSEYISGSDDRRSWKVFDGVRTAGSPPELWQTNGSTYTSTTPGVATGAGVQSFIANGVTFNGHWLKLKLPHKLLLNWLKVESGANDERRPWKGAILGSNDDVNWYTLKSFDGDTASTALTWYDGGSSIDVSDIVINSQLAYNYILFVIEETKVGTGHNCLVINQMHLYGHRENDLVRLPDPTNVLKYPHIAMTGPAQRGYAVTASNETLADGNRVWHVFDENDSTFWKCDERYTSAGVENTSSGLTDTSSTAHGGEYVVLESPNKLNITGFNLTRDGTNSDTIGRSPGSIAFLGKNSAPTVTTGWTLIAQQTTSTYTNNVAPLTISGNSNYFKYHAVVIRSIDGNQLRFHIKNIELLGTEEATSVPIQIGGGNIDKVANFRVYDKFVGEDQALEIWDAQKDEFGRVKSSMTLHKGRLGIGTTEPEGRLAVLDEPHNLEEFPPRAMTGYKNYFEGHGEFCVSASSEFSTTYRAWDAFDKITYNDAGVADNAWLSANSSLYASASDYAFTGSATLGNGTVAGEWLKLELPYKIVLKSITLSPRPSSTTHLNQAPEDFKIYGSNDDINWTEVLSETGAAPAIWTGTDFITDTSSTTSYRYFAIVVQKTIGYAGFTAISGLKYFGTREQGQSVLHDGQLTLTKSLTVPRIGPALDADDTPRRDRLVVEYNTSTNPTFDGAVRDTSGRGFDGCLKGGAYYDASEKALKFDGTGDYTEVQLPSHQVKGDWIHSVSCWVKGNLINGEEAVWNIGDRTGQAAGVQASTSTLSFNSASPTLRWYFYSNDGSTNLYTINQGEWNHIVVVYYGGGHTGTNSLVYINGNKVLLNSFTASAPLLFDETRDRVLMLGRLAWGTSSDLNGCISNFKLYDTALTASEAKTLYDMGRTGSVANPQPLHITAPLYSPGTPVQMVHLHAHEYHTVNSNYGRITPMTLSIKPKFSNSKILVQMMVNGEGQNDATFRVLRYINGTFTAHMPPDAHQTPANTDGIAPVTYDANNDSTMGSVHIMFVDSPNTTGVVEYQLYYKVQNGSTVYRFSLNQTARDSTGSYPADEHSVSSIVLQEIAQ